MTDPSYDALLSTYAGQLRSLFTIPDTTAREGEPTRGASVDVSLIGERSAALAETSQALGSQSSALLDSNDVADREAAQIRLLAQANAEMEVVLALLAAVQTAEEPEAGRESLRSGRAIADAASSVEQLADILDTPLETGLARLSAAEPTRGGPANMTQAILDLQKQVRYSLEDITVHASEAGSLALDTLFSMDAEMLRKAVAPIGAEVSEWVGKAAQGLSAKIESLLRTAMRLLLQAYDWVLALIGKDAEEVARKKVQGWIEELRASHKVDSDTPDLAVRIVSEIFATDRIVADVAEWAKTSEAGPEALMLASEAVQALAASYAAKAERVAGFLKTIKAIPKVAATAAGALTVLNPALAGTLAGLLPAIEVMRGAVTLGLMGYTLFAGYDHVDSGQAVFFERFSVTIPDRVEGVRSTTRKTLVGS